MPKPTDTVDTQKLTSPFADSGIVVFPELVETSSVASDLGGIACLCLNWIGTYHVAGYGIIYDRPVQTRVVSVFCGIFTGVGSPRFLSRNKS